MASLAHMEEDVVSLSVHGRQLFLYTPLGVYVEYSKTGTSLRGTG